MQIVNKDIEHDICMMTVFTDYKERVTFTGIVFLKGVRCRTIQYCTGDSALVRVPVRRSLLTALRIGVSRASRSRCKGDFCNGPSVGIGISHGSDVLGTAESLHSSIVSDTSNTCSLCLACKRTPRCTRTTETHVPSVKLSIRSVPVEKRQQELRERLSILTFSTRWPNFQRILELDRKDTERTIYAPTETR